MRDIQKVHIAHTINTVALSVISIYVPIYLLTLGYPLSRVIIFFTIAPVVGLLIGLFVYVQLIQRIGLVNTFKIYYPLQMIYLILLLMLGNSSYPPELVALLYGAANFAYWMPINLLFMKHSLRHEMGTNISRFFALPKFFKILGPLIGAALIPFVGFWPVFIISMVGVIASYIPLMSVDDSMIKVSFNFSRALTRISKQKSLFIFEALDNIIEESEWFWAIYVYLLIGSLATPGIVGSLEAIGGAAFALFLGKYANKNAKKIIPFASLILIIIFTLRIFISEPIHAYFITLAASFVMTLFLVSYFSTIYKTVKGEGEEEFIILREIPTVLGRLVVFGGIILCLSNLKLFFLVPIFFTIFLMMLYFWKSKVLAE